MTRNLGWLIQSPWFIPGLAVGGTLMRLLLIFYMHIHGSAAFYDETDYEQIATSISLGKGFSLYGGTYSAYRPPAQPLFLSLVFHLLGHHVLYAKIIGAIVLAIIPFVCARVGKYLGLSTISSNVGAAMAAFHPGLAYASATIYPTVITACAVTLGLWLCCLAMGKPNLRTSIFAGLSLGLAGSATTTFAPLAFLASLVLVAKKSYQSAIIICLLGTIPVIIWMVRNEVVLGEFTVATNGGFNLVLGANDQATPRSGNWVDPHLSAGNNFNEIAVDREYRSQAVSWIRAHPARWSELVVARALLVVDSVGNPKTTGLHSGFMGHVVGWLLLPMILLSIVGLVINYRNPLALFTVAALSLVILSSAATIVKPRFRFPCDPLLCEFSVAGFIGLRGKLGDLGQQEPSNSFRGSKISC